MQRDTTKRFYVLHSWVGALTAVLLFVIAFTGAVSVFGRPELKIWAHEVSHTPTVIAPTDVERLLQANAASVPAIYRDNVQVIMPGVRRSPHLSFYFTHERTLETGGRERQVIRFDHDARTLALLQRREGEQRALFETERKDMADFLISFHADLHLGDPIGLMITGLLGLTLFASIVTGVITHRKILREMFTFRPYRSLRLLFTDAHKVIGVWGVLFHSIIAFTGAFLGLALVVLLPAAAYVSFEGDVERMIETVLPSEAPERLDSPTQLSVAAVLEDAGTRDAGPIVSTLLLEGTDENGVALVFTLAGNSMIGETLRYRAATAELLDSYTQFSRIGGATGVLLDTMFPLHFGNFGGALVKFLWFFLGIGTAVLSVSGAMIWLERRLHGSTGNLSAESYLLIARLTAGACAGVVLATVSLFHLQRLVLPNTTNTNPWLFGSFFGLWALAVAWALLRKNVYRSLKELLALTGTLAMLVPLVSGVSTGNHLLNVASGGHWVVAATDITVCALGVAMLWVACALPGERPLAAHRVQHDAEENLASNLGLEEASAL